MKIQQMQVLCDNDDNKRQAKQAFHLSHLYNYSTSTIH